MCDDNKLPINHEFKWVCTWIISFLSTHDIYLALLVQYEEKTVINFFFHDAEKEWENRTLCTKVSDFVGLVRLDCHASCMIQGKPTAESYFRLVSN